MSGTRTSRSVTGGFPGLRRLNQLYDLWLDGVKGQTEGVNELYDHLRSKGNYDFKDWASDVANLWERSFSFMEDLWLFQVRASQKERPAWVSLVWSLKQQQDVVQDEVDLERRVATDQDLYCTDMERLGQDVGGNIGSVEVKPTLNTARDRLTVCIKDLKNLQLKKGHFVGFIVTKASSQPLAIVFLTVTDL